MRTHSKNSKNRPGSRPCLPKILLLPLLALFLLPAVHAQTDYSGTYYIGSVGYNQANITANYYLCPTEGWCYYAATNDFTGTDNDMPFLTTYKCRDGVYDDSKAIWTIEKAPAPNDAYYYIKQALTGRYLTSNGTIRTTNNADRMRVHLEAVAPGNLDDKQLFTIDFSDSKYFISPKGVSGGAADRNWLVVNGGNKNSLVGESGKQNGPTGYEYTAGIIGLYTKADNNAPFYLEPTNGLTPAPVITNNYDGTITITGTGTIYYTTDDTKPTTSSATYSTPIVLTDAITVVKAMAKDGDNHASEVVTCRLPKCEKPIITISGGIVTITTNTPGASIYYTDDNTSPTSSSTLYSSPFPLGDISVIRAIAVKAGWAKSKEASYFDLMTVSSSSEITRMDGMYRLASNFASTAAIGSVSDPFTGIIDGQLNTISGLDHPLVAYAENAVIKNVILDNVGISGGTNVGAICGEAKGNTRIYNCGVLATSSTVEKNDDGYDIITSCSSTISGSGYVGGIVGLLDGSSRVINCFSYANVSGGNYVGGIVGYNNVATTAANLKTMVMNCMFYGEVSGNSIAPIYNGKIITNVDNNKGVSNFNYFRLESAYIQNTAISKVYNCALGAETRFLQRFEFFRHLLNSNRELAAWWATDDADNKDEMMKWVLEPSQIGTSTPYPILKTPGRYASVVNYTPNETTYDAEHRNEGRKLGTLAVTIQAGSGAPTGASITTSSMNLTITDKDFEHFNFNYGKVQLPYYNDYCEGNYTENRVVTGWKIVSITDGTAGSYSTGDDVTYTDGVLTATPYNFADRKCKNKDLYSESGRVFNQGAYWDVPEGVTAITIQPYWGKAVYLGDAYYDVVYNAAMTNAYNVTTVGGGQRYINGESTFNGQLVYTSMSNAISSSALFSGENYSNKTVYDYAVVLVGNYHHTTDIEANKPYTVTSVDLDGDNEPDYSLMLRFNGRTAFHPVRYDFLNLIGLGMAQKSTGGTGSYNLGIMQPKAWFEVTNTALFRVTQFEYERSNRAAMPLILQGGVIEQWVSYQSNGTSNKTTYIHVGGNVWFKEFHMGVHQDKNDASSATMHPPVSVTGGDFAKFYLTGLYQSQAAIYDDNAECYINGGRFGEVAGAGMEGIGTSNGKGNITWVIDHADIREFYGGGINAAKPVYGNIHTIISNSYVDLFCGGPKFGDMEDGRTVTTTATDCTFGTYFGAGYGGNSYNRYAPTNQSNVTNIDWNAWVGTEYTQSYNATYNGVSTQIDYQFIPMSNNTNNVARLFVDYVGFSLATTHNVTSTLTGCTVTGNFYGGGSLGKVEGDVTSTLTNCTLSGSVYGAGYSASLPTVEVMNTGGFPTEPYYYTDLGTYRTAEFPATTTYTWQQANNVGVDNSAHILYTTADLNSLGTVTGNAMLTVTNSTVAGNVYGGGEESKVATNTNVTIEGSTTTVNGSVFGAGNQGDVAGSVQVNIGTSGNPYIKNDVYGGGALANANTTADPQATTTSVTMTAGTVHGSIYGGGLGQASPLVEAMVYGPVQVTVNGGKVDGAVYGCNNVKGSPKSTVAVTINGTAAHVAPSTYAVQGVYGGGNLAHYDPTTPGTYPTVTVNGCASSVKEVYGGGNSAAVPYTSVTVNGGIIDKVFAGGNGFSGTPAHVGWKNTDGSPSTDSYGAGTTSVTIHGGHINQVFGGNNTSGSIRGGITVEVDWNQGSCENYLGAVFGGGNLAPYGNVGNYPAVNIKHGTVSGSVYGGGKGDPLDASKGVVTANPVVTIGDDNGEHYAIVTGNVYGGGDAAAVTGNTRVVYNDNNASSYVAKLFGGGNAAGVSGNAQVDLTLGKVTGGLYGGCNTSGTVAGTTTVNLNGGQVGTSSTAADVFGGGLGNATRNTGSTVVNVNGSDIYGDVYGGSALGQVAATTVHVLDGTVHQVSGARGNVYGGGMGEAGHDTYGQVNGVVTVNIGAAPEAPATTPTGSATVEGYVFGCNNTNGSPQDDVNVNVYSTKHTANTNDFAALLAKVSGDDTVADLRAVAALIESATPADVTAGNALFALKAVYGGGNQADYVPANGKKSTVTVYGCAENTIKYVYGGGRAASSNETHVVIEGGHIYQAFAGGDGSAGAPGAHIGYRTVGEASYGSGTAEITIHGGAVYQVFGGSNMYGKIRGATSIDAVKTCDHMTFAEAFGGNNHAASTGDRTVTIKCGTEWNDVYGGSNEATITGNVTLNILGGKMKRAFGGSKNAPITGNVEVNVYGGSIEELYGGNNVGGAIGGTITVNVDWTDENTCADDKHLGYVYGGGYQAPYEPTAPAAVSPNFSPTVNIIQATVSTAVFGGGYGTGSGSSVDAHVTANPKVVVGAYRTKDLQGNAVDVPNNTVNIGATHSTSQASLAGDVFGGGNRGPVTGNPKVIVQGSRTTVYNNVYGGGNSAALNGNPTVEVGNNPRLCAPEFSLDGTTLTITSHENATIHYTTDGSTPTAESTEYSGPIAVSNGTTVKAIAVEASYPAASAVSSYEVVIAGD